MLAILLIASLAFILVGLRQRRKSQAADLLERPPLPVAKVADGTPIRSPQGTATEGTRVIRFGVTLLVILVTIFLFLVIGASGP